MSISKRVSDALEKLAAGDPESALFQICAAVEQTAKLEGSPKGKKGFKAWVNTSIPVITAVGLGPALSGLRIKYSHPELPASTDGTHSIEDIVYHVIRCGLYHEASLPAGFHITEKTIGPDDQRGMQIPKDLILGIILAVVTSPANVGERTTIDYFFTAAGKQLSVSDFWGKRPALLSALQV